MGNLEGAHRRVGLLAEEAGDGKLRLARADQVLLRPDDEVAAAAALEQRVFDDRSVADERVGGGRAQRAPARGVGLLPVPPARRQAVAGGETAEAQDLAGAGVVVGLTGRVDRVTPEPVEEVGVLEDGAHRGADCLPVHLRLVEARPFRPEEDRVGEGRVVVDVGKASEREREFGADAGAQGADVAFGRGVASLVLRLGVDHQAIGPAPHRGGADLGLGHRALAVDELPGADVETAGVEGIDQAGAELAPVAAGIAGLDVERADAGLLGAGDDAADAAAFGVVDVPDPHALAVERGAPAGFGRGDGGFTGSTRNCAGRGWHVREERHCENGDREEHWADPWRRGRAGLHVNSEHGSDHLAADKETAIPLTYRNWARRLESSSRSEFGEFIQMPVALVLTGQ